MDDKQILIVNSEVFIQDREKDEMEADYIEFNVRQQLPLGIAEQIYENLDMPIFDIQEVYIPQQHQTRYLLRINIISQAELNRLRDIERKYNSIQSPFER